MKYLPKIKNFHYVYKKSETGRGMLEMLGVIAVIGLLSIGGIIGYGFAIDKYRANDIIHEVNMRGEDIWNRFQETNLPDKIDEWSKYTSTGFPIRIVTIPDELEAWFQIVVSDVPEVVCKNVLMGQYDSILVRIVRNDVIDTYVSNLNICENGKQGTVDMIFVWAMNSETSKTKSDGSNLQTPCVTTDDCLSCERCNTGKYACEADCPDEAPYCSAVKEQCVACMKSTQCSSKQICNDVSNTCEQVEESCPQGAFRSKNGACIPCDYAGNIEIDKDGQFGLDVETGEQSCRACADVGQERILDYNDTIAYCSYNCTKGFSYQSEIKGCVKCSDTNDIKIKVETESLTQCLACSNHKWFTILNYNHNIRFCGTGTCPMGYFKWFDNKTAYCSPCSSYREQKRGVPGKNSGNIASDTSIFTQFEQMCNNCPDTPSQARFFYADSCYPKCVQPSNVTDAESIRICQKEGATSTNCARKFQSKTGKCYPCNSEEKIEVGTSGVFYDMCINCGRKVNTSGYCVLSDEKCPVGKFKIKDGTCIECSSNTSSNQIVSEEESLCVANCKIKNNSYSTDEDAVAIRKVEGKRCLLTSCDEGYIINSEGVCMSCTESLTGIIKPYDLDECTTRCKNRKIYNGNSDTCAVKSCPTNQKYYRGKEGDCIPCSNTGYDEIYFYNSEEGPKSCEACGNRMLLPPTIWNRKLCSPINPGIVGICNSIENNLPANLDNDISKKAEPYLNGNYDKKLFRTSTGECKGCSVKESYNSTAAQCTSCGNRRYQDGACLLGLCTDTITFLNTSGSCVDCTTKSSKTSIPNSVEAKDLCTACVNKRVMTVSNLTGDDNALCVPACEGEQWQTLDGNCQLCQDLGDSAHEIGNDSISRAKCESCNRVVYSVTNDTNTIYYCSQYPTIGTHFIGKSGEKVNCEANEEVEIHNTGKSRKICELCIGRTVVSNDDGIPYCVKST